MKSYNVLLVPNMLYRSELEIKKRNKSPGENSGSLGDEYE
jgi:hypothetical protein